MVRPVAAALGQLEHAPAADVRVAIGLSDFLPVARDVIEHEAFAQREIAQRDLFGAEPAKDLVQENGAGDREIRASRLEARDAQPLFKIERGELLADAPDLLGGKPAVTQRRAVRAAVRGSRHRTEAQDGARGADHTLEAGACHLMEVLPDLLVDVAHQLALVTRLQGIGRDETLGQPDDAELEAPAKFDRGTGPPGHLDTATSDVDDHGDIPGHAHAVNGG